MHPALLPDHRRRRFRPTAAVFTGKIDGQSPDHCREAFRRRRHRAGAGRLHKKDDYFESDEYVLSSAVGHLLEIGDARGEEVKRGKWTFAHLPAIPSQFALKPIEKTETRLKLLTRLIKRKDVDALINACDAGREGELIFRYIVQHAKAKQPIQRLWLQSMTPAAIREGFETLRSDREMLPLADAARCRSESDWLVGINGTRAMTAFNSQVGRLPADDRRPRADADARHPGRARGEDQALRAARLLGSARHVRRQGRRIHRPLVRREASRRPTTTRAQRAERLWDEAKADAIRAKCEGKPGIVTEEAKPSTQSPPLLYDLTSLQREANGRFGFSAQDHAVARAGAVRKAQGAHLSADRFARAARGLHRHGQARRWSALDGLERLSRAFAKKIARREVGEAEQADLRQQQDLGSLRDHPDAAAAESAERGRAEALRPGRRALPRGVLPAGRIPRSRRASRASRASRSRPRARCW